MRVFSQLILQLAMDTSDITTTTTNLVNSAKEGTTGKFSRTTCHFPCATELDTLNKNDPNLSSNIERILEHNIVKKSKIKSMRARLHTIMKNFGRREIPNHINTLDWSDC